MGKCNCKYDCNSLAIAASLIIGAITAILTYTAVIAVTPAFLWVALGVAVVYLAVALLSSAFIRRAGISGCVCKTLPTLLTGILGTALASVILLAITFAATSVLGAIITGALLFFLSLILTSTACLVKCTTGCAFDEED